MSRNEDALKPEKAPEEDVDDDELVSAVIEDGNTLYAPRGVLDKMYFWMWSSYADGVDEEQRRDVLTWRRDVDLCGDNAPLLEYPRISRLGRLPLGPCCCMPGAGMGECTKTKAYCCGVCCRTKEATQRSVFVEWFNLAFCADTLTEQTWNRGIVVAGYLIQIISLLALVLNGNLATSSDFSWAGEYMSKTVYYFYLMLAAIAVAFSIMPLRCSINLNSRHTV